MKNKGNAKAQYSKNEIFKAFIELLKEKEFNKISIQEITDKAQVSRKTFYRNFDNKLDVLKMEVFRIGDEYINNVNKSKDLDFSTIAYLVFKTMESHTFFLNIIVQNHLNYLVMDHLHQCVVELYKVKKATLFNKYGEAVILQSLSFTFGGFEKLLTSWIQTDKPVSVDELKKEFDTMFQLFVESFI